MDHSEAVQMMATERYLLGELTPELREAFEAHFFDCSECAMDLRAEAAFVAEARAQLPQMTEPAVSQRPVKAASRRREWFAWWRPAMAVPVFALLVIVIGYQNLATIPSLRSASSTPQLVPWATLHVGTRAGGPLPVIADHKSGAVVLIDIPDESEYASLAFSLQDQNGKQFWSRTLRVPEMGTGEESLSLVIPGAGLQTGAYALTIAGITPQGVRTQLEQRILDIRLNE